MLNAASASLQPSASAPTPSAQLIALTTAQPVLRSSGTPTGGLDLDAVWVGLGTPADFAALSKAGWELS